MKKIILLLVLFLFYSMTQAQITITSSDMPSANDTLRYSIANVDTLITNNYKKTGPNYIWDYSKLKPSSQAIDKYELASATPYKLYFLTKPGEYGVKVLDSINLVVVTLRNIYDFYNKSALSFSADGMGITFSGLPYGASYQTKDVIYKFPLNFSDLDSNAFYFNMSIIGQFSYIRQGYRISEVDGWGSVTTPFGTFNCLRIKSTIHEIDSVKTSLIPFPIGFPNNQVEYKWFAKGEKIPVLQITGTLTGSNFTPNAVRYRDKYRNTISPLAPHISFTADKLNAKINDTISFNNTTTGIGNTYQWNFNPNHYFYVKGTDSTTKNPVVIFTQAGNYDALLTAKNPAGTSDTTKLSYIHITSSTGLNENNSGNTNLSVFPNPLTNNILYIEYDLLHSTKITIKLLDMIGKEVSLLSEKIEFQGHHCNQVDISGKTMQKKGIFFIEITGNDVHAIHKIVIE